jgi:hypothetical protein
MGSRGRSWKSSGDLVLVIALVVVVIALALWCLMLLPGAIDQSLGIDGTTTGHFYHPGTHWMTFKGM